MHRKGNQVSLVLAFRYIFGYLVEGSLWSPAMTKADILQWMGLALSSMLTVFTVAYNRWNAVFLAITRFRFWLTNPTSLWSARVTMSGEFDARALDAAIGQLKLHWPDSKKQNSTDTTRSIRADGLLLELSFQDCEPAVSEWSRNGHNTAMMSAQSTTQCHLLLRINDIRATYRESAALVDRLSAVVEEVNRAVGARDVEFGSTIRFSSENPYFGLYVRRLKNRRLRAFLCTFDVTASGVAASGTVTVGEKCVEIFTTNAVHWTRLSRQYLAVR